MFNKATKKKSKWILFLFIGFFIFHYLMKSTPIEATILGFNLKVAIGILLLIDAITLFILTIILAIQLMVIMTQSIFKRKS